VEVARESHGEQLDASGVSVRIPREPRAIVSLVPSVTETLFALGLGDRVVGVTDWCIHPADGVARLPKVRGTKNPDVDAIAALRPDLVLANLEENRAVDVTRLRDRGIPVRVDYPRTVDEAVEQVRWLAGLGASPADAARLIDPILLALAAADAARVAREDRGEPPVRGFVAVWKDPWMTLSADTYAHDLLARCGIANVFATARERYPRVAPSAVAEAAPEVVLLPDEPYRFAEADADDLRRGPLAATPAARAGAIRVVDGTLVFWHGPRIAAALDALGAIAALSRA
jgi:ABC-type Fe3+-hydroxamate transport system substrate-binding protein